MELQQEIKRSIPFESPEMEAFLNLMRTHQVLTQEADKIFKEYGLTETQYNVLRILAGADDEGLPSLEIARRMITRVPDITRLVDRLQRNGWVLRRPCPRDRRVIYIQLTEEGRRMAEEPRKALEKCHVQQFNNLDDSEVKELIALLEKARKREENGA